ncbi:hypothetical protein [Burkholderia metallica]|uniref:hypothetical protein n=1 Tax=Burkholderia metallica TaxID=488729 RepID=UPI00157A335A|nr:hypothetical protein [Burkholderia metallica]
MTSMKQTRCFLRVRRRHGDGVGLIDDRYWPIPRKSSEMASVTGFCKSAACLESQEKSPPQNETIILIEF